MGSKLFISFLHLFNSAKSKTNEKETRKKKTIGNHLVCMIRYDIIALLLLQQPLCFTSSLCQTPRSKSISKKRVHCRVFDPIRWDEYEMKYLMIGFTLCASFKEANERGHMSSSNYSFKAMLFDV